MLQCTSGLYKIVWHRGSAGNKHDSQIVLPSTLKRITQAGTFANATALTSVDFPEGIVLTTDSLFSGCTALKQVKLPESVTTIGSATFKGCIALSAVSGGGRITEIGANAFDGCTALTSVPDLSDLTEVGRYAFNSCENLSADLSGAQLAEVGIYAFKGCKNLTGSPDLSQLTKVGDYTFNGCENLSASLDGAALTEVGKYAFNNCQRITGSPDLSRLTEVGAYAFNQCYALGGTLDLSSLTAIPDFAFAYCHADRLILGNGLKSIGYCAFTFVSTADDIILPEGLTSIGTGAFYFATLGSGKLTIPDSVTSLGNWSFQGTNLAKLYIGSGLTIIPSEAFADCLLLETVVINAAEDSVLIADNAFPNGVTPVYGDFPLGGKDDAISDEPDAETIYEAAADGGVVKLEKNVILSEPLVINNNVTLTSDGAFTIMADEEENLTSLIEISPGGTLTLAGKLILNGQGIDVQPNSGVVVCEGTLYLTENASISNASFGANGSGTVRVTGTFNMSGGAISDNKVIDRAYSSPGVLVAGGGAFTMSGGVISSNTTSQDFGQNQNERASGAVHVEGYASFTLEETGTISRNSAPGGVGGGVCVKDPGIELTTRSGQCGTAFNMNGGTITGNSAHTGGGIYSYANGVYLNKGCIINNTAVNLGGGVYSEGNDKYYSTLHMENALITGNQANEQGGGLWFCATGEAEICAAKGAAVYGNHAEKAGDDFIFTSAGPTTTTHTATLAGNIPGGGSVLWYKDGGILLPAPGNLYPDVDDDTPRYGQPGADTAPVTVVDSYSSLALKAVVSQEAQDSAAAQLIIANNHAAYGGGVGSNGGIVAGDRNGQTDSLTVTKAWIDDDPRFRPDYVEVVLKDGGTAIDRVKLSADGNWTHIFTGLTGGAYQVEEANIPSGYISSVTGSAEDGFVIENRFSPDTIVLIPADITVYMGGEDGCEGAADESGTIIGSSSLPTPGFTFAGLPQGTDPTSVVFEREDGACWEVQTYPGLPGNAQRPLYTIVPVGESAPVRLQFVGENGVVTSDKFVVGSAVNQTLEMTVYSESIDAVATHINGKLYTVRSGKGQLTVRGTTQRPEYACVGAEFDKTQPGLTAPGNTRFTINGSEVAASGNVALLFDRIIDTEGENRSSLLAARAVEALGGGHWSMELKYLDLVDRDNGDAWVQASQPVTIYWPLPEGTDANTEFRLLHFEGLDREMTSGEITAAISGCTVTDVTPLANDGAHLSFTIGSGGFSPFVLVWESSSWQPPITPPVTPPVTPEEPDEPDQGPDGLNTQDHYAYIVGYPDGTVRPEGSITRAEVATIFFRLLTDEVRSANWSQTSSYTDVTAGSWYNNAISTLSRMGILEGYDDGTFRPNGTITRAEFVTIATRFFRYSAKYTGGSSDVPSGAWYADYIQAGVDLGLIGGYPDGTFVPDGAITRAEACTIVNRTPGRAPDKDHLLPESEMLLWPDNLPGDWYYAQLQEATNSHDYTWLGSIEQWTEKLPERDWEALEN